MAYCSTEFRPNALVHRVPLETSNPTIKPWNQHTVEHTTCCSIIPPHMQEILKAKTFEEEKDYHDRIVRHQEKDKAFRDYRNGDRENNKEAIFHQQIDNFGELAQKMVKIYDAGNRKIVPGIKISSRNLQDKTHPGYRAREWAIDTLNYFHDVHGRNSLDGKGLNLRCTVNYGKNFSNAFFDGGIDMVFGNGDKRVFKDFTIPPDVTAHELSHGFTQYSNVPFVYQNQSGALNESNSDVFGSLVKQKIALDTADKADWLIGEGLLFDLPGRAPFALRSMKQPGTGYVNHPLLGTDPQPKSMADYKVTREDNGGVHINSGIPNHAFYLASIGIGGYAWEKTGKIWFDVMTNPQTNLRPNATFEQFAHATIASAERLYGKEGAERTAVITAWRKVDVLK